MTALVSVHAMDPLLTEMSTGMYSHLFPNIIKENWQHSADTRYTRHHRFQAPYDFLIGIDEDCFIFRPQAIVEMMEYMDKNNIGILGVPEKGVSCNRHSSEEYTCTFFIIYNLNIIRNIPIDEKAIQSIVIPPLPQYEDHWKSILWLQNHGAKRHLLTGNDHTDIVSTILNDLHGEPFLLHTWFARDFTSPQNRQRIQKAYEYAHGKWIQCTQNS